MTLLQVSGLSKAFGGNRAVDGVQFSLVLDDYFAAQGMRITRGRAFTAADRAGSQPVIILNEAAVKRFLPEGDPLGLPFHAQHLDGDLLALTDDLGRVGDARPRHLGDVEEPLHAGAEIDEGAEVEHRGHAPLDDRARNDRLTNLVGSRLLLLFLQRAPRHHEIPPALLVLDDAKRVDVPFVVGRGRG